MPDKRPRYTISGKRAGSTIYVAGRFVKPHPDGGYILSEEQKTALTKAGHELKPYTAVDPPRRSYDGGVVAPDPESRAAKRIAQLKAEADERNGKLNRVPSKAEVKG